MANNGVNLAGFKERVEDSLSLYCPNRERTKEVRESVNSIFEQCDTNNDKVLDQTELNNARTMVKTLIKKGKEAISKMNSSNTPDSLQPARDPKFRGLEQYNLVLHGAKEGVGMITVNGENLLVLMNPDSDNIDIIRADVSNHKREDLTFKNMDELTKALSDPNGDWGKYPGFESLNDVFIY